jgi:hypothetical protein
MELQNYNLLSTIKGSIRWMTSRKPNFYQYGPNFVAVFWKVKSNQDHIYDMFNSKNDIEFYYEQIKSSFENIYPSLNLHVKYTYGPVEIDSELYSRIVYYYSEKLSKYTNIAFAC